MDVKYRFDILDIGNIRVQRHLAQCDCVGLICGRAIL